MGVCRDRSLQAPHVIRIPSNHLPKRSSITMLIPKGMTVLAGSSKIGKSWMALDLAKMVP